MSEKFQKKMFEPFVQEHRNMSDSSSGTGLGLTLVKRIVDLMGGTISVKSVINEGTTFYVDLPAREVDGKMLRTPKKVEDTISLKGRRVLICEDNHLNMEIVTVLLKEKGMEVVTAQNGQEGVALFQNSEEGYFDAVLMDIRMPVMDGYEATRTIRSMERADAVRIPIIAMTADAFAEDIRKCFAVGMDAHISKPIDPRRIFETLQDKIRDKEMQT
jgi:CheY-like chemotaxis protein